MTEDLFIFVPTSPCPFHPSTEVVEQSVKSLWQVLGEEPRVNFYCDGVPSWTTEEENENYEQYKRSLSLLGIGRVVQSTQWVGLSGLVRMMWEDLDTSLLFNLQHDWEFIKPERIRTPDILNALTKYEEVQCIRFNKRPTGPTSRHIDNECLEVNPEKYGVELVATNGWGDSPHFATSDHYANWVIPNLRDRTTEDGRWGVEGPVMRAYRRTIRRYGFNQAQYKWGSFLYGQFGQEGYIHHIGQETKIWRKRKGVVIKR